MGKTLQENKGKGFITGIGLTLLLALLAGLLAKLPFLAIMGQLVIAIILGMIWRAVLGLPDVLQKGVTFSNKKLLRLGIILLGMRLNLADIYNAGINVFIIAFLNLVFALVLVYLLARWFGVDRNLGILTACGTAICGAAAVVAIAPIIKAKETETAVAAGIVALLGTTFTLVYSLIYGLLPLSSTGYGIFAGGTLHEVAHVVAAAGAGGEEAIDMAVLVKLTRVALLVPVAFVIGYLVQRGSKKTAGNKPSLSIFPWFILGFLAMSGFNTLGIVSESVANSIVSIAYILIAMAMAGLGLNVEVKTFRKLGMKGFAAGVVGSVFLAIFGYALVMLFQLN
ncbi:YeiH family protein [Oceanobacillus picturae]|uniref:YeiH family protein n=1 Tax=Oceanobacillus picturae TaxID=171693 RepID=UPI000E6A68AA|nr:putative sulfate exporter family transporter [Oceanobacillus picturae]RIU92607.1 putative sulfate exporter family transporter [Oceanobacillus picturae]